MKTAVGFVLVVFFTLASGACSLVNGDGDSLPSWANTEPESNNQVTTALLGLYSLQRAETCADAAEIWREKKIAGMEAVLASNMNRLLDPPDCWESGSCDTYASYSDGSSSYDDDEADDSASEYTTTNTQEVDVDEADFIKNDGSHIFILAKGTFQILDAWPAEEAHRLSSTVIEGEPRRMFINDDIAVIFSRTGHYSSYRYTNDSCSSYSDDCYNTGDGGETLITVLDISDRTVPKKIRRVEISGSYVSARMIDGIVYLVAYFDAPNVYQTKYRTMPEELQPYSYLCQEDPQPPFTRAAIIQMFEELRQQNLALINAEEFKAYLPEVQDKYLVGEGWARFKSPLEDCTNYYRARSGDGDSILSVISFDSGETAPMKASSIIAKPGIVYGSKQALYVAHGYYQQPGYPWFRELEYVNEATTVHKFMLANDSPATTYVGSGLVRGRPLNQFSMSEHNDHLRIATTSGLLPGKTSNTLSVMKLEDGNLNVVGLLDNLAVNEDIRSVRFRGNQGFMVTFKKTDPLFTFDLSDPTAPRVLGMLKIPGFSTYMHFLDDQHLLTIGYDASDQGDFAWFTGVMLQVFDVSDLTAPTLLHKEVIGTRGTSSDAATNHLAFTWFAARNLLAIPMMICKDGDDDGSFGNQVTFNGLLVYRVTLDAGFDYLGGVPHTPNAYYRGSCYNWWTNANSQVKRSIFLEDWVFSVSLDEINIANIDDPGSVVNTISL